MLAIPPEIKNLQPSHELENGGSQRTVICFFLPCRGVTVFFLCVHVRHLVANEIDPVLDLWNPLTHDGEQLGDGGPGIHQDLQAGGVVRVKEGEGCREKGLSFRGTHRSMVK